MNKRAKIVMAITVGLIVGIGSFVASQLLAAADAESGALAYQHSVG